MPKGAHLRVARPTGQPDKLATVYREGLGFEELGSSREHGGTATVWYCRTPPGPDVFQPPAVE